MIGQKNLINKIQKQIEDKTFPHFCILTGAEGSGKKTLAKQISSMIDKAVVVETGISVSDIRTMIDNCYQLADTSIFIIPDADTMSVQAKNALLKVTEEPPNNSYFIMTLTDINNTLDTIKSRATVYSMENYTSEEIDAYFKQIQKEATVEEHNIIIDICETPGEVDLMCKQSIIEFYDYVELCVDNIAEVSGANSFKLAEKLALKTDADGYDLKMFLKVFMSICINRIAKEPLKYSVGLSTTSNYLKQLGIKGVNKQMLIDAWILDMRKVW